MIKCIPHAVPRAKALAFAAAAAVASTMLFAGSASADVTDPTGTTDPAMTLDGVAVPGASPGCTVMTTAGHTYELVLPTTLTRDQRDLAFGIPTGVPLQVQAAPATDQASYCMQGTMVEVQHLEETQ